MCEDDSRCFVHFPHRSSGQMISAFYFPSEFYLRTCSTEETFLLRYVLLSFSDGFALSNAVRLVRWLKDIG